MTDIERLEHIREYMNNASGDLWVFDEDEHSWDLYAVPDGPGIYHGYKILKAPKQGGNYANYWPNEHDAEFICQSRRDIPWLLEHIQLLQDKLTQKEENNG